LIHNGKFLLRGQTCPEGLPDKSENPHWKSVRRPDISGVQNRTIRFAKPDTLVLTGMRIKKEFREDFRN
jgi:hypothetical protein